MRRPLVLIAGGGIGGLTAALALHAIGIRAEVYEAARPIRPLGVGINLQPHSIAVLQALGLLSDLEAMGAVRTGELRYHCGQGKTIWAEPRGLDAGYPVPQFSVHRGKFQDCLLRAVRERLGDDAVRDGHRLVGFEQDKQSVMAHFETPETPAGRFSREGDVLIGADGLHSVIRSHFYPDQGRPHFSGQVLWRGAVRAPAFLSGRSMVMVGSNRLKVVVYPIQKAGAGGELPLINWVAETQVDPNDERGVESWNKAGVKGDFIELFRDWRFDWLDIPDLLGRTEEVFEFPMVDRDPIPRWTFGRVSLLGDAAHAMYPNGSNGASQAILDAACIAKHLADAPSSQAGLEAYESERLAPTSKLVLENRKTGPERVMQMVEERCQGQCGDSHVCVPQEELEEIAQAYKRLAGFDRKTVEKRVADAPSS